MAFEGIGASVRRVEDQRFLSGRGNYTDDINRRGQLYAVIRRSDRPHARIASLDTAEAQAMPGVVAVYTGADLAADNVGGLPCGWLVKNKDGTPMAEPPHPVLAIGKVRHVGDPLAVVIAESRQQGKDAAEKIAIDWQDLPGISSAEDAIRPGAALLHDEAAGNICYDWHLGDKAAVDAAFAKAQRTVTLDLTNSRLIPNAMEPRAAIGDFDRGTGEHTLFTTSQNPHVIRLLMGAFVLHIPESHLRVVAPDVGGAFGSKIFHYAEEAIVTWAASKLGRPVKWTAERTESFISDAHGRDHVTTAEMALDKDGNYLALRVRTLANMGAYLSTFAPSIPTYLYATLLAGVYRTPAIYAEVKAVFTNTVPVDAYRGAGRPEAAYLLERLTDVIAFDTGIDRVALRRRNFIPA
ncbi:MAG: xanthine dehydrogenase family protein molybdopterin-binding subunit, partial [Acetobacteraceae bacterium]